MAFVTLDGIDVREEFQVLHWQQLVSTRNTIFPSAMPRTESQCFFISGESLADIESAGVQSQSNAANAAETPLGNESEATHASRRNRKRHHTLPSLGDANFMIGLDDDELEFHTRESGYQLCGGGKSKKGGSDTTSLFNKAADIVPKVKSMGHKEDEERPSSH